MFFRFAIIVAATLWMLYAPVHAHGQGVPVFEPSLTLSSGQPEGDFSFGTNVAISDSAIVAGDIFIRPGSAQGGIAYAFETRAGELRFPLLPQLDAGDTQIKFGLGVALHNDHAIVGTDKTVFADPPRTGGAFIFNIETGAQVRLLQSDTNTVTLFGTTVDLNDRYAAVGDAQGTAYVFDWRSGQQVARFTIENVESGTLDVELHEDLLLIGAPDESSLGNRRGAAFLYDLASGDRLLELRADGQQSFGASVELTGDRIFVGASNSGEVTDRLSAYDHAGNLLNQIDVFDIGRVVSLAASDDFLAVENGANVLLLDDRLGLLGTTISGGDSVALHGNQLAVGRATDPLGQIDVYTIPEPGTTTWSLTLGLLFVVSRARRTIGLVP